MIEYSKRLQQILNNDLENIDTFFDLHKCCDRLEMVILESKRAGLGTFIFELPKREHFIRSYKSGNENKACHSCNYLICHAKFLIKKLEK